MVDPGGADVIWRYYNDLPRASLHAGLWGRFLLVTTFAEPPSMPAQAFNSRVLQALLCSAVLSLRDILIPFMVEEE